MGLLKQPFRWIIFGNISEIQTYDFHPLPDSKIFVVEENEDGCIVKEIYKVSNISTDLKCNTIALWDNENAFKSYNASSFYSSRRNMQGTMFTFNFWASNPITFRTIAEYR